MNARQKSETLMFLSLGLMDDESENQEATLTIYREFVEDIALSRSDFEKEEQSLFDIGRRKKLRKNLRQRPRNL